MYSGQELLDNYIKTMPAREAKKAQELALQDAKNKKEYEAEWKAFMNDVAEAHKKALEEEKTYFFTKPHFRVMFFQNARLLQWMKDAGYVKKNTSNALWGFEAIHKQAPEEAEEEKKCAVQ